MKETSDPRPQFVYVIDRAADSICYFYVLLRRLFYPSYYTLPIRQKLTTIIFLKNIMRTIAKVQGTYFLDSTSVSPLSIPLNFVFLS